MMEFNASKCYILPIRKKSSHFYQLNNVILKEVTTNPYLGLSISNDLKWSAHINGVCGKASSTLGFVRRNLQDCPKQTRHMAYLSLVRSLLEYGSSIWDPHTQKEIAMLESVQRQAARFITRDYRSRDPGSMSRMLKELNLPTLQQRRKNSRLTFLYKIAEGLTPAIPPELYLESQTSKRKIKAKKFDEFATKNIVENFEINNSRAFKIPKNNGTDQYKYSFFVRTIPEWNSLDNQTVTAGSLDIFKARLSSDSFPQ